MEIGSHTFMNYNPYPPSDLDGDGPMGIHVKSFIIIYRKALSLTKPDVSNQKVQPVELRTISLSGLIGRNSSLLSLT